jgi:predicted  nucleic acid-binding Zn-ribbon protein
MRTLTDEEFKSKVSPKIKLESDYINGRSPVNVSCVVCGHRWAPVGRSLITGHGCPKCGKIIAKETKKWHITHEQFLNNIHERLKGKVEVLSEYVSCLKPVNVKCLRCDHAWSPLALYLYKGHGCDKCFRRDKGVLARLTHTQFLERVWQEHADTIEVMGLYETGKHRIKVRCLQCNWAWNPIARRLFRRGCPRCCFSKGEKKIQRILESNAVSHMCQYTFQDLISPDGGRLRFDFAILSGNALCHLIEYDGLQHFKPVKYLGGVKRFEVQKRNDWLKDSYCSSRGIKLVRVPYYCYNSISLEMLL